MRKASQAVITAWTFPARSLPPAVLLSPEGLRVEGGVFKRVRGTAATTRSRQLASAPHCSAIPARSLAVIRHSVSNLPDYLKSSR